MRLKVYVIDFEIPARVKKWGRRLGIPAFVLSVAAVAFAAPLHVWATGDTLQATDLNGNFSNLQGQISTATFGTRTPSAFSAGLATAKSIPSGVATLVAFDTVYFDLASEYSTATGVFSPKAAGVYLVSCTVEFPNPGPGGPYDSEIFIRVNAGDALAADLPMTIGSASSPTGTVLVQLAAGDSVTCLAYQSTGAALALYTCGGGCRDRFGATRLY